MSLMDALFGCCSSRRSTHESKPTREPPAGVGGHAGHVRFGDNVVYKMIADERGKRECAFLNAAQNDSFLADVVPEYLGQESLDGKLWIVMENICAGFSKPCLMDLKMGTQTWSTNALPEKIASQQAKAARTTTERLGVRITAGAVRHYWGSPLQEVGYKKGQEIATEPQFQETLYKYLFSKTLRDQCLEEITHFLAWFEVQTQYQFRGCSLLLAYDADLEHPDELRVALIDFAHVDRFPGQRDESFLVGLHTMKRALTSWKPPRVQTAPRGITANGAGTHPKDIQLAYRGKN